MNRSRTLKRGLICLVLLVSLVACKPQETELPFEIVVKGSIGATYKNMDLMIATNPAEAQQIADTLWPEQPGMHFEEIANVDYGQYLVIIAYFGAKPHGGFVITIEKIVQIGRMVNVTISTVEPTGGDAVILHPIHAVKIKRADLPVKGRLSFSLLKDGKTILTREHLVP